MLQAKDGNQAAFAELYKTHQRRVLDFFYGLCGNAQTAKDLTQETFLRIWKLRGRYAATGSFVAYLLTFGRYVWLEHCRGLRKRNWLTSFPFDKLGNFESRDPSSRPDNAAMSSELGAQILEALSALPDDQRMVFVLQIVDGLSTQETASVMQCPINTVRSRKIMAIKKLRASLKRMKAL